MSSARGYVIQRTCPPSPFPRCQHLSTTAAYVDDYRGPRCEDYPECKAKAMSFGTTSTVCECDSGDTVRKIAKGPYPSTSACALGDEWRVLHRLRDVPCVVRPVAYEDTLNVSTEAPVRPMRTIKVFRVRGRPLMRCALSKAVSAEFGAAAACSAMRRALEMTASHAVGGHDLWASNFILPYDGSWRQQCPFVLIDMPEHNWVGGRATHWHGWHKTCLLLRGAFSCDLRCESLPDGSVSSCAATKAHAVKLPLAVDIHGIRRAAGLHINGTLCPTA